MNLCVCMYIYIYIYIYILLLLPANTAGQFTSVHLDANDRSRWLRRFSQKC